MSGEAIRPSGWWYLVAAMVLVAGGVLSVRQALQGTARFAENSKLIKVPGTTTISFSEADTYTIFYEHQSTFENRIYRTEENLSGLRCTMAAKSDGKEISLSDPTGNATYTFGGHSGTSVFEFQIDQPGEFVFAATYSEDNKGPEVIFAFRKGSALAGIGTLALDVLAIVFCSLGFSVALVLFVYFKREKARKALAAGTSL